MNASALLVAFFLLSGAPAGFQAPPATGAPPAAAGPAAPAVPTYRIGLEDEIRLVVVGEEQLTNTFRVQSDGSVTLPLLGTIPAQGLTTIELQERIRAALAKEYMRNPQVRVEMSKYGSQFVIVQGEVRAPQKVAMTGPMTLNEALAAAGSWTPNASSVVNIARKRPQQDAENIHVNLDDLSRGIAGADIPLVGGDIITVPKAETIFVQGQVKNVGVYNWEPGLTVNQAITKAGGISDKGRDSGIKITRLVAGKNREIDVKLIDLVQPNDIIYVPQRRF